MKIWVDDIRPNPGRYDTHTFSVNETVNYIIEFYNEIEEISLDYNAGKYSWDGGNYIRILDFMESQDYNIPIHIHTTNPVDAENIRRIIRKNKWKEVKY